jgi:enediyne biosynthesis protein CalE3
VTGAAEMLKEDVHAIAAVRHAATRSSSWLAGPTVALSRVAVEQAAAVDPRLLLMHQVMLGDGVRLDAYDRAFAEVIRPGDVVIDVGAGLLILSLLALRHGAAHVFAIEADPRTAALAREIVARNNLTDRLTIIEDDAREVELAVQADVIVSEMMGNLGPEEEMVEIIEAVARRNLRPGGKIVPQRLATRLAAVEFDREGWGVWRRDFFGYSLEVVQERAPSAAQLHFFSRAPVLLSAPAIVQDAGLGTVNGKISSVEHRLIIKDKGSLQAVVGYFTATLSPSVALSNFPSYPGCNWATWVWPVRHTAVFADDVIEVSIRCPAQLRLATDWRLDCRIARKRKGA